MIGDPTAPGPGDVTRLLVAHRDGDATAFDRLVTLLDDDLGRIARGQLRRGRIGHGLETTGLVHEAYVRLAEQSRVDGSNRAHVYAVCALAMRRILIGAARRREAAKRGSPGGDVTFDEERGADAALRARIESLLAHVETEPSFLRHGEALDAALRAALREAEPPSPNLAGSVIDRYRIVREIGRGGMGVVCLAERADGVHDRQVALKLIRRDTGSRGAVARFERERRVLARASAGQPPARRGPAGGRSRRRGSRPPRTSRAPSPCRRRAPDPDGDERAP